VHNDELARSDPELLARVGEFATGRKSRLAAALIDLAAQPSSRFAFVGHSPDLPFEIGSITKALTGMLLADCVEADLVSLDSEVGQIATVEARSELASVSLLELATHTSGLPRMPRGIETRLRALPYAGMGLNPYFVLPRGP
jgi:CubicO group peptidase (beta-lactamase class C family)